MTAPLNGMAVSLHHLARHARVRTRRSDTCAVWNTWWWKLLTRRMTHMLFSPSALAARPRPTLPSTTVGFGVPTSAQQTARATSAPSAATTSSKTTRRLARRVCARVPLVHTARAGVLAAARMADTAARQAKCFSATQPCQTACLLATRLRTGPFRWSGK